MQPNTELTPIQLTLLNYVTRGWSILQAAQEAPTANADPTELSWATVMEWNRTIPEFRLALDQAIECRALLSRERAYELSYEALQVLPKLLRDEKASTSVRLRASLAVIKMATHGMSKHGAEAKHKPAPEQQPQAEPKSETAENSEIVNKVHKAAQSQSVGLSVEPGRNSVCPCGSGAKFKRCCGNPAPTTAAQQSVAA
jgi:uncharacterized protein YecA (UPF0149 family)